MSESACVASSLSDGSKCGVRVEHHIAAGSERLLLVLLLFLRAESRRSQHLMRLHRWLVKLDFIAAHRE